MTQARTCTHRAQLEPLSAAPNARRGDACARCNTHNSTTSSGTHTELVATPPAANAAALAPLNPSAFAGVYATPVPASPTATGTATAARVLGFQHVIDATDSSQNAAWSVTCVTQFEQTRSWASREHHVFRIDACERTIASASFKLMYLKSFIANQGPDRALNQCEVGMQDVVEDYFIVLLQGDELPHDPYPDLVRRVRVMELQPRLFRSLKADAARLAAVTHETDASQSSSGIVCPRGYSGAWGLPHVMRHVNAKAFDALRELHAQVEVQLPATRTTSLWQAPDCRIGATVALCGPQVWRGGLLLDGGGPLALSVDVEVRGPSLERAAQAPARVVVAEQRYFNSRVPNFTFHFSQDMTPYRPPRAQVWRGGLLLDGGGPLALSVEVEVRGPSLERAAQALARVVIADATAAARCADMLDVRVTLPALPAAAAAAAAEAADACEWGVDSLQGDAQACPECGAAAAATAAAAAGAAATAAAAAAAAAAPRHALFLLRITADHIASAATTCTTALQHQYTRPVPPRCCCCCARALRSLEDDPEAFVHAVAAVVAAARARPALRFLHVRARAAPQLARVTRTYTLHTRTPRDGGGGGGGGSSEPWSSAPWPYAALTAGAFRTRADAEAYVALFAAADGGGGGGSGGGGGVPEAAVQRAVRAQACAAVAAHARDGAPSLAAYTALAVAGALRGGAQRAVGDASARVLAGERVHISVCMHALYEHTARCASSMSLAELVKYVTEIGYALECVFALRGGALRMVGDASARVLAGPAPPLTALAARAANIAAALSTLSRRWTAAAALCIRISINALSRAPRHSCDEGQGKGYASTGPAPPLAALAARAANIAAALSTLSHRWTAAAAADGSPRRRRRSSGGGGGGGGSDGGGGDEAVMAAAHADFWALRGDLLRRVLDADEHSDVIALKDRARAWIAALSDVDAEGLRLPVFHRADAQACAAAAAAAARGLSRLAAWLNAVALSVAHDCAAVCEYTHAEALAVARSAAESATAGNAQQPPPPPPVDEITTAIGLLAWAKGVAAAAAAEAAVAGQAGQHGEQQRARQKGGGLFRKFKTAVHTAAAAAAPAPPPPPLPWLRPLADLQQDAAEALGLGLGLELGRGQQRSGLGSGVRVRSEVNRVLREDTVPECIACEAALLQVRCRALSRAMSHESLLYHVLREDTVPECIACEAALLQYATDRRLDECIVVSQTEALRAPLPRTPFPRWTCAIAPRAAAAALALSNAPAAGAAAAAAAQPPPPPLCELTAHMRNACVLQADVVRPLPRTPFPRWTCVITPRAAAAALALSNAPAAGAAAAQPPPPPVLFHVHGHAAALAAADPSAAAAALVRLPVLPPPLPPERDLQGPARAWRELHVSVGAGLMAGGILSAAAAAAAAAVAAPPLFVEALAVFVVACDTRRQCCAKYAVHLSVGAGLMAGVKLSAAAAAAAAAAAPPLFVEALTVFVVGCATRRQERRALELFLDWSVRLAQSVDQSASPHVLLGLAAGPAAAAPWPTHGGSGGGSALLDGTEGEATSACTVAAESRALTCMVDGRARVSRVEVWQLRAPRWRGGRGHALCFTNLNMPLHGDVPTPARAHRHAHLNPPPPPPPPHRASVSPPPPAPPPPPPALLPAAAALRRQVRYTAAELRRSAAGEAAPLAPQLPAGADLAVHVLLRWEASGGGYGSYSGGDGAVVFVPCALRAVFVAPEGGGAGGGAPPVPARVAFEGVFADARHAEAVRLQVRRRCGCAHARLEIVCITLRSTQFSSACAQTTLRSTQYQAFRDADDDRSPEERYYATACAAVAATLRAGDASAACRQLLLLSRAVDLSATTAAAAALAAAQRVVAAGPVEVLARAAAYATTLCHLLADDGSGSGGGGSTAAALQAAAALRAAAAALARAAGPVRFEGAAAAARGVAAQLLEALLRPPPPPPPQAPSAASSSSTARELAAQLCEMLQLLLLAAETDLLRGVPELEEALAACAGEGGGASVAAEA
ncbi:hypothetical protein JKP88DRAFT_265698 [Tribonema minus]|uniref:Uncharacterized protein n=1 Tax=Tribonema minus TaxID=303371 RepID=A0A835YJH9_9STRA|nr:hypothetical protein JKP88DRAFT_265698 [Tribonema minus]